MKLYSMCTKTHTEFMENWFLPTLKDEFDVRIASYEEGNQVEELYGTRQFNKRMFQKIELIIKCIKENWGGIFIYSDIDVQFFRPFKKEVIKLMAEYDVRCQKNSPYGDDCPGFIVCRGNEKTLKLFSDIKNKLQEIDFEKDDQDILNNLLVEHPYRRVLFISYLKNKIINKRWLNDKLRKEIDKLAYSFLIKMSKSPFNKNPYNIKSKNLPLAFFSPGALTGKRWQPGQEIHIPESIVLHHANWTVGVENKLEQLKYIRDIVEKRMKVNFI